MLQLRKTEKLLWQLPKKPNWLHCTEEKGDFGHVLLQKPSIYWLISDEVCYLQGHYALQIGEPGWDVRRIKAVITDIPVENDKACQSQ
jgi:hypothetical protein